MPNNFDKLFNQAQGNELINALKGIKSSLDVNYPLETVNVTLSNNAQNITPSENYYGLGQVNVPGMNLSDMTILVNGNYDPVTSGLDGYGKLNVNVPTWSQADEGKVVSNNALVPQTNREVNANGTYDTTLNNSVLVNVPNTFGPSDEGKVVMNNALVPQTNRSITQNGTYDTTTNDEVVVNVEGGGGSSSYPWLDATYDGTLQGYMPKVTHSDTKGEDFAPASSYIEQAVSSGFSYDIYNLNTGKNSLSSATISITRDKAILSVADFIKMWMWDVVAKEYRGNIYNTSKIEELGLVLLGDFSQGGSLSDNVLEDSIANYTGIILQGIYNKNRESNYNTSILYQDIVVEQEYWAGMKDRNTTYDCFVTFTDNTHCGLSGKRQVIIYGIL